MKKTKALTRSQLRHASTGYLYPDGHLVLLHDRMDKKAGRVEWATIHESVTEVQTSPGTRIVLNFGSLILLLIAKRIQVSQWPVEGSPLEQTLTMDMGLLLASSSWILSTTPSLAQDFKIQTGATEETFQEVSAVSSWGDYRVASIHPLPKEDPS